MAKLLIPGGSTSVITHIFVPSSSSTTGGGKTALAFGDFTVYYVRAGGTLAALTPQDIATLGTYAAPTANTNIRIKLMDDTNAAGLYEVQFHNDHLAVGANQATFMFTATGAAPTLVEIQLLSPLNAVVAESYAADTAAATPAQLLYMIWSRMAESSVVTTTLTAKKLDGSTEAMVFTLDSATDPTSITRAS